MSQRKRRTGASRASFTVRFYRGEDGYFVAYCRQLPGCVSQGKSMGEARENIREAMVLYLETLSEIAMRPHRKARRESEGRPVKVAKFSLEPISA